MDRREQQHVETLHGDGRVWHNGEVVLQPARYRIDVSGTIHIARTMNAGESRVPGLGRIEGTLLSPVPWSIVGEPIELELDDGRRWKCFIQSSDGNLVNRDGIA